MSSLLNNASLLLNPAGSIISYQEDKIYSVLPNNGTGDFTFSGGDGGTRVNQQGYIEVTPANLVGYSEDLSAAGWSKVNISVSYNSIANPITGQINAPLCTVTNPNANIEKTLNTTNVPVFKPSTTYTMSGYVKAGSITSVFRLLAYDGNTLFQGPNIDLSSSNIGNNGNYQYIKDGWYRVWYTFTTSAGATTGYIYPVNYNYGSTITTGTNIYFFGAMMNEGSSPKPYQPTTDRLNYPRITYQNGRGALLSEPQRTNLCTYSEDLTNGVWSKTFVSITANDTISPDGTQNADRVTRSANTSTYFNNTNTLSSSNRVNSMFFKKGTIDQVTLLGNSYSSGTYATFNLSNGTIINSAGCTPFVEQYRDGWYRCGFVQTNGINYYLLVTLNGYNNDTVTSGEYLYAWGGQTELGTYPTSYIPTTSATVTRPNTTVLSTTNVINNSEGVLYLDFSYIGSGSGYFVWAIDDGSNNNRVQAEVNHGNNTLNWVLVSGGSVQAYSTSTGLVRGQRYKAALDYRANDVCGYLNGVKQFQDNGATMPSGMTKYAIGAQGGSFSYSNGNTYTAAYFNSSQPDATLETLTTVRSGSGGNISYYGPYTIHTFTGSATFTPSFNGEVEVLVVAGGGGGGVDRAGAGGAGGLLYVSSYGVSAGTGVTVTIGAGGAGTGQNVIGVNGSNSVFGGLTAIGGGGGGTGAGVAGANGGSGGGGGNGGAGGTTPGGLGITGQGNNGGSGTYTPPYYGAGGGGGAGAPGVNGTNLASGNGGDGLPYSISGFSTYYAGGGGAGTYSTGLTGVGGLGGGGNGYQLSADAGVPNTGGGGGSSGNTISAGGNGGSGIVIVRYLT